MNSVKNISTLGTCRIFDPVRSTARNYARMLSINNTNVYGYTHSAAEALQLLNYLNGQALPRSLARYFSVKGELDHRLPREVTDLYIVEISSLREIVLDGIYLQKNYIDRVFKDRRNLSEIFWSNPRREDKSVRKNLLIKHANYHESDDIDKHFLTDGYIEITDKVRLESSISQIKDQCGKPVLFVGHIDVASSNGRTIVARKQLNLWLAEICKSNNLYFYDPSYLVIQSGREHALESKGHDINHYSSTFIPIVGKVIFEKFIQFFIDHPGHVNSEKFNPNERFGELNYVGSLVAGVNTSSSIGPDNYIVPSINLDIIKKIPLESSIYSTIRIVKNHIKHKRFEVAVTLLSQASQLDPSNCGVRILMSGILSTIGDHIRSCIVANELVRNWSDDVAALDAAAKAFRIAGDLDNLVNTLEKIIRVNPQSIDSFVELSELYFNRGRFSDAEDTVTAGLSLRSDLSTLHKIRIEVLKKRGSNFELAEAGLTVARYHSSIAISVAEELRERKELVLSAKVFAELLATDRPSQFTSSLLMNLSKLGFNSVSERSWDTAVDIIKLLYEIGPDHHATEKVVKKFKKSVLQLARIYSKGGNFHTALQNYNMVIPFFPRDGRLALEVAIVAEKAEEWSEAHRHWCTVVELGIDPSRSPIRASKAALRAYDYSAALMVWHRLLNIYSADERAIEMFINTKRKIVKLMREDINGGRLGEAQLKAEILLLVEPNHEAALKMSALIAKRCKNIIQSNIYNSSSEDYGYYLQLLIKADPVSIFGLSTLAKKYENEGNLEASVELFNRLAMVKCDDYTLWRKVWRTYVKVRDWSAARSVAQRMLELVPSSDEARKCLEFSSNRISN
jgi:tetratricopeptide (TPR) repeat protein